jgi:hypothetical protein
VSRKKLKNFLEKQTGYGHHHFDQACPLIDTGGTFPLCLSGLDPESRKILPIFIVCPPLSKLDKFSQHA